MFFYQFNIKDFHYDTGHLDIVTEGTYRRLIDFAYETEEPINDIAYTSRRIRCEENVVTAVLEEFFQKTEEGWVHTRIQKEVAAYKQLKEKAKASAERRWNANPMPTQCPPIANPMLTKNQEPRTINQEPIRPPTPRGVREEKVDEGFESFWTAYPRKTGKGAARNAWVKAKLPAIDLLLSALHKAKKSPDWIKDRGAFIPHPATWLNQGRWEDSGMDYEALTQKRVQGPSSQPQEAFLVDDHDALLWIAENYEVKAGVPYRDWPQNVQAEYRNHIKQPQVA
jgi:uncharacterized protein YdaU (DUF1376 family)